MAHRDKRIILAAACLLLIIMNALVHVDFSKTALGCSFIFLSISQWFNENEPVKLIVSVVSSYIGFTWLFNAIVGFYTKPAVWSFFNKDVSLDGDWVYVFDDSSLGCAIFGYFKVSHSIDGLSIKSARCWYSGTPTPLSVSNQRGIWSSKSVSQTDGSCYIFYEMHINNSAGKPESIYYGVMMMSVDYDSKLNTKLPLKCHSSVRYAHDITAPYWPSNFTSRTLQSAQQHTAKPTVLSAASSKTQTLC